MTDKDYQQGAVSCSLCLTLYDPMDPCQGPLSTGFSTQEYWSGLSFTSPGDVPDSGIEPRSPTLQVDSLTSESSGKPGSRSI